MDKSRAAAQQNPTQVMLGKLAEQIPGMSADKLSGLDADNFTPDKVAGRISDFVAKGLDAARARGASDERLNQMYDAAVKGVEKGFKEAREILDSLDMLNGSIATQVDETEKLTFEALTEIAPGSREAQAQAVMGAAERYRNAEDMSLTVKTQDGDEVSISFSRNQSQDMRMGAGVDSDGNAVAWMDVSRSESSQYQFSVKGELDEGEIDALQQMIRDIAGVADEFFNGDVQKAFEQSADISFDASELQSMQLDMSYSRSWAQASTYEQVGNLDQPKDKPGLRLGQLMKDLAESAGAPSLGFLQSPAQAGRDILGGLVEQDTRFQDALEALKASYRDNLQQLVDTVLPLPEAEAPEEEPRTD
ncbi:DUF5610 domain-containing protein [Marinobacterium weihaiense]|uniref:DUF5610 domain-containing protein n=1 Tax=Marinobacterium weihaiense TaxID=2851016 RepID=A0ABS6ME71_9GAMM|nr:DUF5610 domain-containing protein [Marinobacterium weihaiense]MBV0934455.1 DUF5610 domain-containing protein [Marinobacterium weihaiense]